MTQNNTGLSTFKQILCNITAQYANVTPKGIKLTDDVTYESVKVTIVDFKPARSKYRNKKPVCRSFNGINSLKNNNKLCATCDDKNTCTPQILLEFMYIAFPFRIMMAYTSAKNFLKLVHKCQKENINIIGKVVTIRIIDRGRWGEIVFHLIK